METKVGVKVQNIGENGGKNFPQNVNFTPKMKIFPLKCKFYP